jgi:hypothetical protein
VKLTGIFMRKLLVVCSLLLLACGCAHYRTPGGGVSIPAITDSTVAEALSRRPAAQFPARVIVARVQAAGYRYAYGSGAYTVVTTREIETDDDFTQLASLPGIAAVGALNRILLPLELNSAQQLREAAAQLHGDIVLLYTVDTKFHTENQLVAPLQLVTLGMFASEKSRIVSTCAAAFVDVRTGFVYGVAEGSASDTRRSSPWTTEAAIDSARLKTEREAFSAALQEMAKAWMSIDAEYNRTATPVRLGRRY